MSDKRYYLSNFTKEQLAEMCAAEDARTDGRVHLASVLQAENAKLRESAVLQSAIFKHQTENVKLRELAVLQSVIFKHMSTCPTTDCQVCPVNEECAESVYLEGLLGIDDKETSWLVEWRSEDAADVRAENAKLRKLCKTLYQLADESYVPFGSVNRWMDDFAKAICAMRELGIEVEK